jgi:cell division protein FtsZ
MIHFEEETRALNALIRVVGVGGGGGNAVNNMIQGGLRDVEFIAVNTDSQALRRSLAPVRIQLGENVTRGLGAGADPEKGYEAAQSSEEMVREALEGADMVFVTAGMGGGTGTGGAPVVARIARELGCLTVGVVTRPFGFEGKVRARNAESGVAELRRHVDTLLVIPNERLFAVAGKDVSARGGFAIVDGVLFGAVKGIADIITKTGLVNVDFADVVRVMKDRGRALMGNGTARGPERAVEAAQIAISSPLLEDNSVTGATAVLVNVTGSPEMGMDEFRRANQVVQEAVHEDAEIIIGVVEDEEMEDDLMVTVIATGFDGAAEARGDGRRPRISAAPAAAAADAPGEPVSLARREERERKVANLDADRPRRPFPSPIDDDEEFEIPAFLRRTAD